MARVASVALGVVTVVALLVPALPLAARAQAGDAAGAETEEQSEAAPGQRRRPGGLLFERPGRRRTAPSDRPITQPTQPAPGADEAPGTPAGETRVDRIRRRRRDTGPDFPKIDVPSFETIPVPDRWRIVEALGVNERFYDPYNQNTLKSDRPIFGTQDIFFNLSAISDTLIEPRRIPLPVGLQGTRTGDTLDLFGDGDQLLVNQNLILQASLIQGDTVFRPPDYEFRIAIVANANHVTAEQLGALRIDPADDRTRFDWHIGLQELFIDKHLDNHSDRYDFDSLRVGVQPFTSDFRGFLFQDNQLGVRLFGNFFNNRLQYNLAYFRRMEKDTNSGLNEFFDLRDDDVFAVNAYYQDFPVLGFTLQGTVVYNRNREKARFQNENGFQERPAPVGTGRAHDYDVVYLGLNGDGHIDRLNLTFGAYMAFGRDDHNPIAGRSQDIRAGMVAVEASIDRDWWRPKVFAFWSSGDDDPTDGDAGGFDAIFDNPQFAGADTSYWQRQGVPFVFGGGVVLSGRNSLIPSLRSSKELGQSNFVNPGLILAGAGVDLDVLPELRIEANASYLRFDETASLRLLRNQPNVDPEIGWDISGSLLIRPLFSQNIVLRLAGAVLLPGDGMKDLFETDGDAGPLYSAFANLILTY